MLPVVVLANQLANILAAGAVSALTDLLVDEGLERFGQGNVHGAYREGLDTLPKIGKTDGLPTVTSRPGLAPPVKLLSFGSDSSEATCFPTGHPLLFLLLLITNSIRGGRR